MEAKRFVLLFLYMYPFGNRYKSDLVNYVFIYSVLLDAHRHFGFRCSDTGPSSEAINKAISDIIDDGHLRRVPIKGSDGLGLQKVGLTLDFELGIPAIQAAAKIHEDEPETVKLMRAKSAEIFFLTDCNSVDVMCAAIALSHHLNTFPAGRCKIDESSVRNLGFPFDESNHNGAIAILKRLHFMIAD